MKDQHQTDQQPDKTPLTTIADLQNWLSTRNINFTNWGQQATKTLENLWHELQQGETYLESNPPLRVSRIVQVIIHQNDKILIEAGQELQDKQWRARNFPPSEKMKPHENFQEAALRCLFEELGVEQGAVTIIQAKDMPQHSVQDSLSYPGLQTRYIVYTVEVAVADLPDDDFCTTEAAENSTDPVRIHHWAWHKVDEIQQRW